MENIWERQRMEHSSYSMEDQNQQLNGNIKKTTLQLTTDGHHNFLIQFLYSEKIKIESSYSQLTETHRHSQNMH